MGDEQAETYLRLLAEAETRRAGRRPGPGIARSLDWITWAGQVLVTAGLLTPEGVSRVATELQAALLVRRRRNRSRYTHQMTWVLAALTEPATPPEPGGGQEITPGGAWGIAPVGQRIGVADDRAPSDLYLMTLVRSPAWVTITAAMRMHWPDDGSSADLEITGAGPQHLPYGQLWAADDRGTRYRVEMYGEGGTLTWQGALGLDGSLPPDARWLDLIADGARLARIDLGGLEDVRPADAAERARPGVDPAPPGERMLAAAAEHILASAWDSGGPRLPERLAEMVTVLTGAGALAADSPTPGHLAALCQRLDVRGHGITAPAAAQIPDRWAEVLPPPGPGRPAGHPGAEWFAPVGPAAADADGRRFAFAGLTSAGGQTFLHVVAAGLPAWPVGYSWWVRDDAGRWHLATETGPHERSPGVTSRTGMSAYRLRLTPPLTARPDALEVVVTGRRQRVRAVVPVRAVPGMPDT